MDAQERKIFWDTLRMLPSRDPQRDMEKLKATIKLPKLLYRYRPVTLNSLEALRTNKLYFSSANYYDDPFDTFLHIDIDAIRQEFLKAFQTHESTVMVTEGAKPILEKIFPKEWLGFLTPDSVEKMLSDGLVESFLSFALALRDEV